MASAKDVAQWMADQIESKAELDQQDAAAEIQSRFGDEFLYDNENGNTAISRAVLKEFRKLTPDVVWDGEGKYWRKREPDDDEGRATPR